MSADEGHVFHNRLTHSLQVAQVGRRIAEKLLREPSAKELQLDIDADVVEAACLAHDLGHPPFGHIAEEKLDQLARSHGLQDGYEGNAQSFRIITKLAMGSTQHGLNLTRATLNAVLKYPWLQGTNNEIDNKWGAYDSERELFEWARILGPAPFVKSIEAELMDWSDDVTYSVHDLDDFFRAGVIPLDRIIVDAEERARFYEEVFERRKGKLPKEIDETYLRGAFDALITMLPIRKNYSPTKQERIRLRSVTSTLIGTFIRAVSLGSVGSVVRVNIEKKQRAEVFMLKQLTWHYVIKNPALATQQHGQTRIIRALFDAFYRAATSSTHRNLDLFPISVRENLDPLVEQKSEENRKEITRLILDFIASLTEEQAVSTCHRITGITLGSSLVHKVR